MELFDIPEGASVTVKRVNGRLVVGERELDMRDITLQSSIFTSLDEVFIIENTAYAKISPDSLLAAAIESNDTELVRKAISIGGKISSRGIYKAIIQKAPYSDDLIDAGMRVDEDMLYEYIRHENAEKDVIDRLVRAGANVNYCPDPKYFSIEPFALKYAFKHNIEIARHLVLRHGADVHMCSEWALIEAISHKHNELADFLIEQGARVDINIFNFEYYPLYTSIIYGNVAYVDKLVDLGCDVNARAAESPGYPLKTSVSYNMEEIVELLIKRGADIHIDSEGPLKKAIAKHRRGMVRLLIERGARVTDLPDEYRRALGEMPHVPTEPAIPRASGDAECVVMQEPLAPEAAYRACVSNVTHIVANEYAQDDYADTCPACKLRLQPFLYINN